MLSHKGREEERLTKEASKRQSAQLSLHVGFAVCFFGLPHVDQRGWNCRSLVIV